MARLRIGRTRLMMNEDDEEAMSEVVRGVEGLIESGTAAPTANTPGKIFFDKTTPGLWFRNSEIDDWTQIV